MGVLKLLCLSFEKLFSVSLILLLVRSFLLGKKGKETSQAWYLGTVIWYLSVTSPPWHQCELSWNPSQGPDISLSCQMPTLAPVLAFDKCFQWFKVKSQVSETRAWGYCVPLRHHSQDYGTKHGTPGDVANLNKSLWWWRKMPGNTCERAQPSEALWNLLKVTEVPWGRLLHLVNTLEGEINAANKWLLAFNCSRRAAIDLLKFI